MKKADFGRKNDAKTRFQRDFWCQIAYSGAQITHSRVTHNVSRALARISRALARDSVPFCAGFATLGTTSRFH
ncbi:MAG: hypothetical protein WD065_12625 [Planctomycetaceae bacterium]